MGAWPAGGRRSACAAAARAAPAPPGVRPRPPACAPGPPPLHTYQSRCGRASPLYRPTPRPTLRPSHQDPQVCLCACVRMCAQCACVCTHRSLCGRAARLARASGCPGACPPPRGCRSSRSTRRSCAQTSPAPRRAGQTGLGRGRVGFRLGVGLLMCAWVGLCGRGRLVARPRCAGQRGAWAEGAYMRGRGACERARCLVCAL